MAKCHVGDFIINVTPGDTLTFKYYPGSYRANVHMSCMVRHLTHRLTKVLNIPKLWKSPLL
jgi:hypothetical protein